MSICLCLLIWIWWELNTSSNIFHSRIDYNQLVQMFLSNYTQMLLSLPFMSCLPGRLFNHRYHLYFHNQGERFSWEGSSNHQRGCEERRNWSYKENSNGCRGSNRNSLIYLHYNGTFRRIFLYFNVFFVLH